MRQRERLFFFGATEMDRPFIQAIANQLGLPLEIRRSGIVYRTLAHLPRLAASRRMQRLAQIISPWVEAIELRIFTRSTDLILIRNIRTGISYLTLCVPLFWKRPEVVLTWFTMKGRPPAYWSAVYRRALLRAFRVFVFTPTECDTYASWFEVPSSCFKLVSLEAPSIPPLPDVARPIRFDVIMTGETNRDWQSFAAVCEQLPSLKFAAVLPAEHARRLPSLPNLQKFERLPFIEYCQLITQSTIQLILVLDHGVAVGQRDFLLAGQLAVPLIATSVQSMRIYDLSGDCVLFVAQADVPGICNAIKRLLEDEHLRTHQTQAMKARLDESHSLAHVASQWAENLAIRDSNSK